MAKTRTMGVRGGMKLLAKKTVLNYRETKPTVYGLFPLRGNVVKHEELVRYAAAAAHVPETSVDLAMDALFDALDYFCTNGHGVQVPELGTFKPCMSSKAVQSLEDVDVETVRHIGLRFYPKGYIRKACSRKNVDLEIVGKKELVNERNAGEGGERPNHL